MRPFLGWVGGKLKLARTIAALIPKHVAYVEPFVGSGAVLFAKKRSQVEIINDIHPELICLYRVIQHHREEFLRCCSRLLVSRQQWNEFVSADVSCMTDIQRAVRFYYLVKNSFASKLAFTSFAVSPMRPAAYNLETIDSDLVSAQKRLNRVLIENKTFRELIPVCDRKTTFFYCDPPYRGCENFYGKNVYSYADTVYLRDVLSEIDGKFLLSLNDVPDVRRLFNAFCVRSVDAKYTIGRGENVAVKEVLIANYDLPENVQIL